MSNESFTKDYNSNKKIKSNQSCMVSNQNIQNEPRKKSVFDTQKKKRESIAEATNACILSDTKDKNCDIFNYSLENSDKMKIFKFYFIANNFDNILQKLNRKIKSRRKSIRKSAKQLSRGSQNNSQSIDHLFKKDFFHSKK